MPGATHVVTSFLGGELSKYAEGRYDKPDYKTSMRTCLNAFPVEAGAWMRRPGTKDAGTTLNGAPGRVIEFDFKQASPITGEYTDGNLRFRSGPTIVGGTLMTPYTGGAWANIRAVQAETTQILLLGSVAPQALIAASATSFSINPAVFNDGPYLDPLTNGAQLTPGSVSGIVTLTLAFPIWSATKAYANGAFVTKSSVNYVSLADQNVNHDPASLAPWWVATSANAAINNGQGFLGSDIGRLIRLFSEPAAWAIGGTYSVGQIVSYNPSGLPNASTYWRSLTGSNIGNVPGTDAVNWSLLTTQGAAVWSWGKIVSLSNLISGATGTTIGTMTSGGGIAAAFDGIPTKVAASSAKQSVSGGSLPINDTLSMDCEIGKNYTGGTKTILQATVFPATDAGLGAGTYTGFAATYPYIPTFTLNLRAKSTAPASPSDGTLLGTSGSIANTTAPVTIISSDQTTAWNYVWIEMVALFRNTAATASSYAFASSIAQVEFFAVPGTAGTDVGINVEILGPALLSTAVISTWRLGVYSGTTGYPTCGIYFDGRIYLGGAVDNRFDACYANGIVGGTINFAPTDQFGTVTPAHAISYTFNSDSVNPILWMAQDLQGVLMGTQAGEWLVQAPTAGSIAPTNISARNVTHHGSEFIQPVRTEHTLIFVKRAARKLLEFFPDVISGKFSAPNLAEKAEHIVAAGIAELAYTSAVTPIIWGRDKAGALFGMTYKRDSLASAQPPTFFGWHRHTLGSGRVVESICSGASVGGNLDALTMVTNDPATGIRRVEILTDTPGEDTDPASAWQLDDAVNPTVSLGASSATLSGLPWADGAVVQVFAGGLDCGDLGDEAGAVFPTDFTVAGGAITVPYGDSISAGPGRGLFTQAFAAALPSTQIVVGFAFNSDGQIVKPLMPADSGSRSGPAFGLIQRIHRASFGLVGSFAFQIGMSFSKLMNVHLKQIDDRTAWPAGQAYTGLHGETMNGDYTRDGALCWRSNRVFPLIITQLAANLESVDQ